MNLTKLTEYLIMKPLIKIHFVILLVICCCLSNCKNSKNSNDSMQPYDSYPLLSSKEEILEHLRGRCIDTIKFKKGEIIADVGAGNGYIEAHVICFS